MASSASTVLLRNGVVLQHDAEDRVITLRDTDILVAGGHIQEIGKHIHGPQGCLVLDCTDKIVCPGFIDTHHHVWQTQLKGRYSDDTLLDYTAKGEWSSSSVYLYLLFHGSNLRLGREYAML